MTPSDDEIDRLYIDPVIALIGKNDISGLPAEQVRIAHVTLFAGALINGGLLDYLVDTKGEYIPELKGGLVAIGESAAASVMQQALEVLQERLEHVPKGQDSRIHLSGDQTLAEKVETLEKSLPEAVALYGKAMETIRNHLSGFMRKK